MSDRQEAFDSLHEAFEWVKDTILCEPGKPGVYTGEACLILEIAEMIIEKIEDLGIRRDEKEDAAKG